MTNITAICKIFNQHNLNPKIELNYTNNFTLLIAVILSAQTTDKAVNIVTKNLFEKYNNPEAMLLLTNIELEEYIKTIGLYRVKTKNILNLCHILITKYNSKVPNNLADLIALPGVGRKTADVVLSVAFAEPRIAVDCHIYRVVHRVGITSGKNPTEVSDKLLKIIPNKYLLRAHHWLVLHGRYVCKAKKPDCQNCCISKYCLYYKNK